MNILEFKQNLASYKIFSLDDINKNIENFSYRQIDRWKKKGYIKEVCRGFFTFIDLNVDENFLFYMANQIYSPSYVSLESALSFYNLIPEGVFQITSVSTKKTTSFANSAAKLKYRHIKPDLFWGYRSFENNHLKNNDQPYTFLMADSEKAILDYCYLNTHIQSVEDFAEMRIDEDVFEEIINLKKFEKYLQAFENKALNKRVGNLLISIENAKS